MARKYHTTVREEKAVEIIVEVNNFEEYKNAWLIICNNAREYSDTIYKVSNANNSNIYVLCNPDSAESTRSWLSQFGEIIQEGYEKVAVFVDVSCDYTKSFDEDYIDSEYVFGETD